MMGQLPEGQGKLFYQFCLENHIPQDHLRRGIDRFLDFSALRQHLIPYYSFMGRPSVDPELSHRGNIEACAPGQSSLYEIK